jgi:hypothetical protein
MPKRFYNFVNEEKFCTLGNNCNGSFGFFEVNVWHCFALLQKRRKFKILIFMFKIKNLFKKNNSQNENDSWQEMNDREPNQLILAELAVQKEQYLVYNY